MTHNLERILVGLDDTPSGWAAVDHGLALAAEEGAHVIFANVVSIVGDQFMPHGTSPDRVPERAKTAVLVAAEEKATEAGVACSTELLVGYPPKELALLADEADVDLIVVGSRRLGGVRKLVLGSTSRGLLNVTKRPVLIIPEPVLEPAMT
jgi:nucleotide-binding universal stress UspA family protein